MSNCIICNKQTDENRLLCSTHYARSFDFRTPEEIAIAQKAIQESRKEQKKNEK